jgi:hypothetical protein
MTPPLPFDLPEQSGHTHVGIDIVRVSHILEVVATQGSWMQFTQLTPMNDVDVLHFKFYGSSAVGTASADARALVREAVGAMQLGDQPMSAAEAARTGSGDRPSLWQSFRDTLSELFFPAPPRRRKLAASFDERLSAALDRLGSAATSTEDPTDHRR